MTAANSSDSIAIRRQLARVCAGVGFARASRRRAFLTFVVEESLAGRGEGLKEVAIGDQLFGAEFDPAASDAVRILALRVREKLEAYYQNEGITDPVRIELPKGGYAPVFRLLTTDQGPRRASAKTKVALTIVAAVLIGAISLFWPHKRLPSKEKHKGQSRMLLSPRTCMRLVQASLIIAAQDRPTIIQSSNVQPRKEGVMSTDRAYRPWLARVRNRVTGDDTLPTSLASSEKARP